MKRREVKRRHNNGVVSSFSSSTLNITRATRCGTWDLCILIKRLPSQQLQLIRQSFSNMKPPISAYRNLDIDRTVSVVTTCSFGQLNQDMKNLPSLITTLLKMEMASK